MPEPQRHHDMLRDPAREVEVRFDKPYDEQTPSHIVHWNGSLIASWDRPFLAAATRAVLEHYEQERLN